MIGSFQTKMDGKVINCDILHTFEYDGNKYIIYNISGEKEVNASKYTINNSNEITLLPLSLNEWNIIDKEWKEFYG